MSYKRGIRRVVPTNYDPKGEGCALLRKKFKEDLFTSGIEHGILQDPFEPSNENPNVGNAPREPFVVNQDPGKTSSQSPPQINHHCYYGYGDPLEECSSCGALYTTDYRCSVEILEDKIICDLDKTPDFSQRSPQNCSKCGHPVIGHYCQGCALLRKKFKEDLFTS
nr:hypothetical protein [Tanacetum cinerariifolium]